MTTEKKSDGGDASLGGCACGCTELLAQIDSGGEIPEEWLRMMRQMMEECFREGTKVDDTSEEVAEEA